MAHHPPVRIAAFALSVAFVTSAIAGLGSYSNAKYADAFAAAQGQSAVQPALTAIAPLRVDVVHRRNAA